MLIRFWCVFTGIDEILSFKDTVEKCLELHRVHISFFLFFIKCELMEFYDNFIFSTAIDFVQSRFVTKYHHCF